MIARVYGAINAVAEALSRAGIAKDRLNARDDYLYRSIDDVLNRLSPLLAQHRLCILPRVIERTACDRVGEEGALLVSVTVRCAYTIVSAEDGSSHTIEAFGEALDAGDKGTAKALQSAYKYAMLQAFCVPVAQAEDADARSHRLRRHDLPGEPDEGWSQWGAGFEAQLANCKTIPEVTSLQDAARSLLASVARENPDLYRQLGQAIASRRTELTSAAAAPRQATPPPRRNRRATPTQRNGSETHA